MLSPALFAALPPGQASAPAAPNGLPDSSTSSSGSKRPDGNFADELQAALAGGAAAVNNVPPLPQATPDSGSTSAASINATAAPDAPTAPNNAPPDKSAGSDDATRSTAGRQANGQQSADPAKPANTDSSATAGATPAKTAGTGQTTTTAAVATNPTCPRRRRLCRP